MSEKELRIKGGDTLLAMIKSFSATEKVVFGLFTILLLISAFSLFIRANQLFMKSVPTAGGQLSEGVVGFPRLVNPVLAVSDVDRDLSALVYAGLLKYENGKLIPDMAKSYTISPDGLTYTFILKDDITFQDGTPFTTDDVEFTVNKIQDADIKSPRRADWANVSVKKIDTKQIQFILKQPYAPFISNTTVGILPKHIWKNVNSDQFIFSQYNIEPIGSGPYRLASIERDSGGIPVSYTLTSSGDYKGEIPFISKLVINFFEDETAEIANFENGTIESISSVSPAHAATIAKATDSDKILATPLPRIFGVFFNQNQAPVLADATVRQALNAAIDKNQIIKDVLYGYGNVADGPIPSDAATQNAPTSSNSSTTATIDAARAILVKAGWVLNADGIFEKKDKKTGTSTLAFSISTSDSPDLKHTADILRRMWTKLGAKVDVKVFEASDLNQNVIQPRKYDAILFGESVGKDLDLYAFWHSSQRNAPGLNIAMYVNPKADKLLEDARATSDESVRKAKYDAFETIIANDTPAIFLYSPDFIYILPDKVKGMQGGPIAMPSDRWNGISKWFIDTESVWNIFVKK